MSYETVIGLEVHVELGTDSKIYCTCSTEFGADENMHVCPVCMGMPGTLPAINKTAVEYCVKAGLALDCKINQYSRQDRKHYFYPDLPKAFQTSQYDLPLCYDGYVDLDVPEGDPLDGKANKPTYKKRIGITRIHIEEDAGKLIHESGVTRIDYNRCGVPLIEIVTEPDFRSSAEVYAFLNHLRSVLLYAGVSNCRMEEGSMRCDVNLSLRESPDAPFGTRTEAKNIASMSATVRCIEYERSRQEKVLKKGGVITQDTIRWDDEKGISYPMRTKEDAHDYFYFPEPDIMPIVVDDQWLQRIKDSIPELPHVRRARYMDELGLSRYDAEFIVGERATADFFDGCIALGASAKAVANWLMSDFAKLANEQGLTMEQLPFGPEAFVALLSLVEKSTISRSAGSKVLEAMFQPGETRSPEALVKDLGLAQVSDEGAILAMCQEVVANNPKAVEDYKAGKAKALTSLVGQVMKASKGKANPAIVNKLLTDLLKA